MFDEVSTCLLPSLRKYRIQQRESLVFAQELYAFAKELQAPFHLLKETARLKRLPVVK
jgi:pyridoxal biosynthesis lyase PdxS